MNLIESGLPPTRSSPLRNRSVATPSHDGRGARSFLRIRIRTPSIVSTSSSGIGPFSLLDDVATDDRWHVRIDPDDFPVTRAASNSLVKGPAFVAKITSLAPASPYDLCRNHSRVSASSLNTLHPRNPRDIKVR